jgi:hypothetical protein
MSSSLHQRKVLTTSSLLHHLAHQRGLEWLAVFKRSAGRVPPCVTVGEICSTEEDPLFGIDDEGARGSTDRRRGGRVHCGVVAMPRNSVNCAAPSGVMSNPRPERRRRTHPARSTD